MNVPIEGMSSQPLFCPFTLRKNWRRNYAPGRIIEMVSAMASFMPPFRIFWCDSTEGEPRCSTRGMLPIMASRADLFGLAWDVEKDEVHASGNPLAWKLGRLVRSGIVLADPVTLTESTSRARRPNLDDDMVAQFNRHLRHPLLVILSPAWGAPVEHAPSGQYSSWTWS
jgi:hypothetical protein